MDVVLEFADSYIFDRIYAHVLPLQTSSASFDPISTITASFKNSVRDAGVNLANATLAAATAAAGTADSLPIRSTWEWEPASKFLSAEPSEYAYLSQWDRDNICRQSITLFFVTM
jgi:lathosterol oxidase